MTTAAEIRERRTAGLVTLQAWADELNERVTKPLIERMYLELFSLERRVWARYDRCCHEGRKCVPPHPRFFDIVWSDPHAPALKD